MSQSRANPSGNFFTYRLHNMPTVSVIIPTYNRLRYLKETIASVCAQTLADFELIVVADSHQPDVEAHVQSLHDERVRYLAVDRCGFPSRPRNAGIRASSGRFIAFCDDDDVWHPDKLAEQVRLMDGGDCGLCFTRIDYIDEHSRPLDRTFEFRQRYRNATRTDFLLSLGFMSNSTVMIRRSVTDSVGLLDEDPMLRAVEDYQYWARVLTVYRACYIDRPLVRYRIHTGSIQPVDPWKWLRKQVYLHRSIHRANPIPLSVRTAKYAKLGVYALRLAVQRALAGRNHE